MRQINKETSGPPSRYSTCDWFYHAPPKQPEKPITTDIPLSQIPGLSDFSESEQGTEHRKKWIRDTDSEYVKLAKQGGRPDLLKHYTHVPNKSSVKHIAYAAPDWYVHEEVASKAEVAQPTLPSYMIHEDFKHEHQNNKYESRRGPFDYDVKTVWQREADENEKDNKEERKVKLPAIRPKFHNERNPVASKRVPPTSKDDHMGKKVIFPPMPVSKSIDPVNFSKLMSNGYGDEWIQQNNDREKKSQQKSTNSEKNKGSETSQPE
ncbi:uncharacterized protein C7orf57 homolog [Microcaecilia unicolor]|uniref:Uncharacterized protein C7orf57 homolog n=1 Tax=Microcaecilia unicolor TaxID=1415580 RepID=A0A6P7YK29_9AMPH|nr:uncharacterized protein C7orf57 homolog [Microcaecilia unicolor]XP_030065328.1 uncharacterized protein C7orf57 homolog [Microcaecilia unicolor]